MRPTPKGYVTVPLAWLARVVPLAHSAEQLAVLLLLYRRCCMERSNSVVLSNAELAGAGVTRFAKYRALAWLAEAGAATIAASNGRAPRVTLNWFP